MANVVSTIWPPVHTLVTVQPHAVDQQVLRELDACARRCSEAQSWAPHNELGYAFAQLDKEFLQGSAAAQIVTVVAARAATTWGRQFSTQNRCWLSRNTAFLLKYDCRAKPPPPHLDIKALPGAGAQTANAIVYLSTIDSGETVLLGAAGASDIEILPERGKLVMWRSYTDAGVIDPRARHTARGVKGAGVKVLLALSLRRAIDS